MLQGDILVFIDRNNLLFFKEKVKPVLVKEKTILLTDDKSIQEDKGLQDFKVFYLFERPLSEYHKIGLAFLNSLQKKMIDDQNMLEMFDFEGISVWHMVLAYSRRAVLRIISYFELFEEALEKYKVKEVVFFSCPKSYKSISYLNDKFLSQRIIQLVARQKNLKTSEIKFNPYLLRERIIFANLSFTVFVVFFRFGLGLIKRKTVDKFGQFFRVKKSKSSKRQKKKIIFVSASSYWRRSYNPFSGCFENIDTINYPIIWKLKDKFEVLGIETRYLDKKDKTLKEKQRQSHLRWKSFEGYFSFLDFLVSGWKYLKFLKNLERHSAGIKKELLIYKGINLSKVFQAEIRSLTKNIFYCLFYIETAKRIVKKEKPVCCFLTYETGPPERAIIYACQKKGILTFGLQHGVGSYDTNFDYLRDYSFNPEQALLPSYLFVYGKTTKDVFMSGGYPLERIRVIGNPEYDFYGFLTEKEAEIKSKLLEKYDIPRNKKVVLFVSINPCEEVTQKDINYHLEKVYFSIAKRPEYFLITKLHPAEKTPLFHETVLKEKQMAGRYIIVKDEACIGELVLLSDIVIMYASTAGYEALIRRVPLVSINFTGYVNSIGCIKEGIVPVARDIKDLDYFLKKGKRTNSNKNLEVFLKSEIANYPDFDAGNKILDFVTHKLKDV